MNPPRTLSRAIGLAVAGVSACASLAMADANVRPTLDPNFPVSMEDAYPVKFGQAYFKFVSRYAENVDATSTTTLAPEVAWGFAPNFDVHLVDTNFVGDGPRTNSGDLNLNTQWLILDEKQGEWWPAVAVEGDVLIPTGKESDGCDFIVQPIVTKTLTWAPNWDELHLNLTYQHNFVPNPGERDEAYNVIFGYSRRITDTTTFLTDVLWEKRIPDHTSDQLGEIGLVQEIGDHVKIAAGVGFSLGDDAPDYTATLGIIINN